MNDAKAEDDRLERIKREEGVDNTIAEQADRPIHHVEKELDPQLIEAMRKYLGK